jgi:hypothetical protein
MCFAWTFFTQIFSTAVDVEVVVECVDEVVRSDQWHQAPLHRVLEVSREGLRSGCWRSRRSGGPILGPSPLSAEREPPAAELLFPLQLDAGVAGEAAACAVPTPRLRLIALDLAAPARQTARPGSLLDRGALLNRLLPRHSCSLLSESRVKCDCMIGLLEGTAEKKGCTRDVRPRC